MAKSRCSLAYHELENGLIDGFSTGVKNGVNGDPVKFPAPPVNIAAFDLLINDFTTKLDLWNGGGIDQRGPFLDSKTALMDGLDDSADYVDTRADGNETTIVAGGFTATKITRTPKPVPEIPTGTKGMVKGNGIIEAECDRMKNAEFYGAICSTSVISLNTIFANGQFNFSHFTGIFILMDSNKDRVKSFSGLTGGTNYYIQFFCGNGKGTSMMCEPIRIMATS